MIDKQLIQTFSNAFSISTYAVVYKATIPQDVAGSVKEMAIYPGARQTLNAFDSKFISDFENNYLWFDSFGYNPELVTSPSPRIGATMFKVIAPANSSKEYYSNIDTLNISGYSGKDTLRIAYNQSDTNLNSIKVKFYSSDSDYFYISYDSFTSTGEGFKSKDLSSLTSYGNPDGTSIVKIGVEVFAKAAGTATVYLDGLRINDEDTFDPRFGMIARSVLSSPLAKVAGRPVDIEYRLALNF